MTQVDPSSPRQGQDAMRKVERVTKVIPNMALNGALVDLYPKLGPVGGKQLDN